MQHLKILLKNVFGKQINNLSLAFLMSVKSIFWCISLSFYLFIVWVNNKVANHCSRKQSTNKEHPIIFELFWFINLRSSLVAYLVHLSLLKSISLISVCFACIRFVFGRTTGSNKYSNKLFKIACQVCQADASDGVQFANYSMHHRPCHHRPAFLSLFRRSFIVFSCL